MEQSLHVRAGSPPRHPLRVDVYEPKRVRLWLRFYPGYEYDVEGAEGVHASAGESPAWFEHEESLDGWYFLLGIESFEAEDRLQWMLEHGVAPGQCFQVEIRQPTYYPRDYWGEYPDPDYHDPVIVQVEPWPQAKVAEAFERAMKHLDML